jgi:hypothetical protein
MKDKNSRQSGSSNNSTCLQACNPEFKPQCHQKKKKKKKKKKEKNMTSQGKKKVTLPIHSLNKHFISWAW